MAASKMDVACLICCKRHPSEECPERTKQNCPNCHFLIRQCSNHSPVCAMKTWIYDPYSDMYAVAPKQRVILSFSDSLRLLKDGSWRKCADECELYSPETGAFFRFMSERDVGLLSKDFAPVRISIVVSESDGEISEKLVLLTSKKQVIVSKPMNRLFNKAIGERNNSLVLMLFADDKPTFTVSAFPKVGSARHYRLQYNEVKKLFEIPSGLSFDEMASTDIYGRGSAAAHAGMEAQSNIGAQSLQLANIDYEMRTPKIAKVSIDESSQNHNCSTCFGAHHSVKCGRLLRKNCFDCHVPINSSSDHDRLCSAKWYKGERINGYVEIPSERCVLTFNGPMRVRLENGDLQTPQKGLGLFSAMSDSYFKFDSDRKLTVLTTSYTRIRIPIIAMDGNRAIEKLVVMTSYDRSLVVAKGSREVGYRPLDGVAYNTPLVLYYANQPADVHVQVHSEGGVITHHDIRFIEGQSRFQVPDELNVKKTNTAATPDKFDAPIPLGMRR